MVKRRPPFVLISILQASLVSFVAWAGDQPQWGEKFSRNMVSGETGLPGDFDPETGKNVKWVARLGRQSYSTPVVANGRVFIGTNNARPRDPRHRGDRGILMCLSEEDGSLLWQLVVPKLKGDPRLDWPGAGIVSPPTVEGDRVYAASNRCEIMCLDIDGQKDGNDGPYKDEARHAVPAGEDPVEVTALDADIIWIFDMQAEVGAQPHDSTHCSPLIHGNFLYANTCNGVDTGHKYIPSPDAPSLIVLDKRTGRLVGQDKEHMGPRIVHCTWSSPSLGVVDGRPLVFFGGGDGVCYGFETLNSLPPAGEVKELNRVWRFCCDPEAPKNNVHKYMGNRKKSASNIKSMPVFHKGRVYVTAGGDIWWGKREAWLKCIDASKKGDITRKGKAWSYALNRHCCSTPAVYKGLVFVADCGRYVHCVDAGTGKRYWSHRTDGEIWASPLVADGKVYIGTRRRTFWVFAAGKEKEVISSTRLENPVLGTAVASNGTLYVPTMRRLYALKKDAD